MRRKFARGSQPKSELLLPLVRLGQVLCALQMSLERRQRLARVCFHIRVLRIRGFFFVNPNGFRMAHNHLLGVAMIEGRSLQLLERRSHLVMRGIQELEEAKAAGTPSRKLEDRVY